ncbi:MAG: DUF1684 domain-containing protein [Candidatus Limnocylindrales bacterium]
MHHASHYTVEITNQRAAKDEFFRTSHHSPIPDADRPSFTGLAYYAVDPTLRFEGLHLQPYAGAAPAEFLISTSDNQSRSAKRLGHLTFQVNGEDRSLVAYALGATDGSLFVPFLDATSGTETYGAGRYLDLHPEPDATYVLDFNEAYQPYCTYSPYFSCPLTPAENRLPDRIEAGERMRDEDAH